MHILNWFSKIFLLAGMLMACGAQAQQQTIHGKVIDTKTKEAIIGAIVRNTSGGGTATDTDGLFQLNSTGPGDILSVEMLGYDSFQKTITSVDLNANPMILELKAASYLTDVVVVSAGKFEQNLGEVTMSMEVVPAQLLQDKNVVSADEALQQTPGVSIVDGEPQIRSGSGYSFGAGSRVQILIDDLPMLSGDAGRPSWGFFPVENVSQVEVIKGASSVLYGSSALSGVINFRTAFPADTARTVVTLYHGAYSQPHTDSARYWNSTPMRTGCNFLHAQKLGALDLVLAASYYGDDGHLGPMPDTATGAFEDKYNPFTVDRYYATNRARINMNMRYRNKQISGLSYGLNTNWSTSNSLATLLWDNNTAGLYRAYEGSATRTIQLLGTVDPYITYYGQHGNKHSLRTRWQTLDNDNDNNQGNFSDVLYGEYQWQQHWDSAGIANLTTTTGLVAIKTDARGQLFTGGNVDGHNTASNYAMYLQVDKKFFDCLNASVGVRYEYFEINKVSDSKPVFRAGINYQLAKASYARASFGQGYRFPSVAEKFIVTGVGSINIFANPELIAETSYNAEVGFKQGFRIGQFMGYADVAYFYQHYTNFIEFTFGQWEKPVFGPGIDIGEAIQKSVGFKSVNTGEAEVSGFEFSMMGEGNTGRIKWQTLMGYTYTKPVTLTPHYSYGVNQDVTNTPITYANTSSDTANYILKYRMQHLVRADVAATWKRCMLGVSLRYNSHMQNIDYAFQYLETELPFIFNPGINDWRRQHTTGDYVVDLRLAYSITTAHRVSLIVNNALNREYAIRPLAIEEMRVTMLQYVWTI
ncbi:MAG: TonB-dependent receptor [Flavobacteriales bacterium]